MRKLIPFALDNKELESIFHLAQNVSFCHKDIELFPSATVGKFPIQIKCKHTTANRNRDFLQFYCLQKSKEPQP